MIVNTIKSGIIKYFKIWWIPILSYILPFGIFVLGAALRRDVIIDISLTVFFINILGNIVSAIIQIIIRKWYWLIPQLTISALLFFFVSIIFAFSPPDYYGVHKTIPNNIDIHKPIESIPTDEEIKNHDFVLSSCYQPGIYCYYTNHKPKEIGSFYIKAFEINSNDKLSEERIKMNSKIKVKNLESELYSGEFTIYEGSWGDKYGARIELWFAPSDGKKDYKITERNYIVEGWMR